MKKNRKAQIWVSVVIYTLIGITAIGLLLVALQPRIKEARDSITIKQTVEALHIFDSALRSTLIAPGNKRQVEFKLSAGELRINAIDNKIEWTMKSSKEYSEPGFEGIKEGTIGIFTEEGNPWKITLTLDYKGVAYITFNNQDKDKLLPKAGKPYLISIENLGKTDSSGNLQNVNIKLRD